jgi:hypothetical protein
MGTLKSLKDEIKTELDRPDIGELVSSHIALAIRHYEREPFWFNERRAIATAVSGTEFYTFPSDFVAPLSLGLTNEGNYFPLQRFTHEEHEALAVSGSAGQGLTYAYSVIADQIRAYPIPDRSMTFTITYIRRMTALNSASASSAWSTDGEELIKARAQKTLCLGVLKQPDWAAGFAALEQEALTRLKSETMQRTTQGRSVRWGW